MATQQRRRLPDTYEAFGLRSTVGVNTTKTSSTQRVSTSTADTTPSKWREKAPCKGLTKLFYPDEEWDDLPSKEREALSKERNKQAKAVCFHCPVKDECGAEALDNHEVFGVWGQMTTRERRKLRESQ